MREVFLSFASGLFVGGLFTLIKLPIPAPPVLSGVIGILGVYLGAVIVNYFLK